MLKNRKRVWQLISPEGKIYEGLTITECITKQTKEMLEEHRKLIEKLRQGRDK